MNKQTGKDATPRPWKIGGDSVSDRFRIGPGVADLIRLNSNSRDTHQQNAELIVRAVNSFDSLLEAAKLFIKGVDDGANSSNLKEIKEAENTLRTAYQLAEAAIKKAEASV